VTPPSNQLTTAGPPIGHFWDDPERPPRRPWYRRWVFWVGVVVVIGGAAAISDLPQHSTLTERVSAAATVVKQVNTDVHPCTFATAQAFSIYHGMTTGTFPAGDRGFVPGYLRDDERACTFASGTIYGMSTITLPNSTIGDDFSALIKAELQWSTSDAAAAMVDIRTLLKTPRNEAALKDLAKREKLLAHDRATAETQLRAVEHALEDSALPALNLPNLPVPSRS
jgi:hypothetical protein